MAGVWPDKGEQIWQDAAGVSRWPQTHGLNEANGSKRLVLALWGRARFRGEPANNPLHRTGESMGRVMFIPSAMSLRLVRLGAVVASQ
jgi:hypothetical protein